MIGLGNQLLVFSRVAILHRFYCTLLYGETDQSMVTSRNMEEVFVTMLVSCMSFMNSLMVIDYTLLLDETDESAVTSRSIDEVFVTMPACLSGIFSSLWTQN